MVSGASKELPEEVFVVMAAAITGIARLIDKECDLTLGGWLVLWYLEREGVPSKYGPIVLRHTLTLRFEPRGFSRPTLTKTIRTLANRRLVKQIRLTDAERIRLFGQQGSTMTVAVTATGQAKVEEFKRVIRTKFEAWRSKQHPFVARQVDLLRPIAMKLADMLMKSETASERINPQSSD